MKEKSLQEQWDECANYTPEERKAVEERTQQEQFVEMALSLRQCTGWPQCGAIVFTNSVKDVLGFCPHAGIHAEKLHCGDLANCDGKSTCKSCLEVRP